MAHHTVALRSVASLVSSGEHDNQQLVEDLTQIGCQGLLAHPSILRSEEMVRKFMVDKENE